MKLKIAICEDEYNIQFLLEDFVCLKQGLTQHLLWWPLETEPQAQATSGSSGKSEILRVRIR